MPNPMNTEPEVSASSLPPKPGTPLPWPENEPFPTNMSARTQKDIDRLEMRRRKDWAYAYHAANSLPSLEARIKVLEEALEGMILSVGKKPEVAARLLAAARAALNASNRKDA